MIEVIKANDKIKMYLLKQPCHFSLLLSLASLLSLLRLHGYPRTSGELPSKTEKKSSSIWSWLC